MERKWHEQEMDGYTLVINEGGKNIAYSKESGLKLIEADGYAFKDLNGNGVLEPFKDWRLPVEERVADLAKRLSIEEIAGLMLYSAHQSVAAPDPNDTFTMRFAGTYDGEPFDPEKHQIYELTDQQKAFLEKDNVRHILMTSVESASAAAKWNNRIQAFCEGKGNGVPASISSDPRHGAASNGEFFVGAKGLISQWPSQLGMAAAFDPELVREFGRVMAKEYRALGIVTALSPQIDLASDPRWNRYNGTFGEGTKLSVDLARAYVDGCQTTEDSETGWGKDSVNAMVKHWPGGGSGEGGRDAHFSYGKYAVYPGNNLKEHLLPFTEGAFKLDGKTEKASSVMPYYTISWQVDKKYGENVGNAYNKYLITDLLREKYAFDGVVCTDWGVTHTCDNEEMFSGMNWGVHHLTEAERHYKAIMAGVDQFGGNQDKEPVLTAYRIGCASIGEEEMRKRMETSAKRLLRNIFRLGLFENPYVDPEASEGCVGCPDYMKAGYEAQKRSVVMLKNREGLLPVSGKKKIYIPEDPETMLFGIAAVFAQDKRIPPHPWISDELAGQYFDLVKSPEEADLAIVFMENPKPMIGGYSKETGYVPVSLQYRPYTAVKARAHSIASGDPFHPENPDRGYQGKTNTCSNEKQLDVLIDTKKRMGDKPVIVALDVTGPMVISELEPYADAILMGFELQKQVYLEAVAGCFEPSGLLPFQIPESMDAVETQLEDVPRDAVCYTDQEGHTYDFAFGMNYQGVIEDERVKKYR